MSDRAQDIGSQYPSDAADTMPSNPADLRSKMDYLVEPKLKRSSLTNTQTQLQPVNNYIGDFGMTGTIETVYSSGYCVVLVDDPLQKTSPTKARAFMGFFRFREGDRVGLIRTRMKHAEYIVTNEFIGIPKFEPPAANDNRLTGFAMPPLDPYYRSLVDDAEVS